MHTKTNALALYERPAGEESFDADWTQFFNTPGETANQNASPPGAENRQHAHERNDDDDDDERPTIPSARTVEARTGNNEATRASHVRGRPTVPATPRALKARSLRPTEVESPDSMTELDVCRYIRLAWASVRQALDEVLLAPDLQQADALRTHVAYLVRICERIQASARHKNAEPPLWDHEKRAHELARVDAGWPSGAGG